MRIEWKYYQTDLARCQGMADIDNLDQTRLTTLFKHDASEKIDRYFTQYPHIQHYISKEQLLALIDPAWIVLHYERGTLQIHVFN